MDFNAIKKTIPKLWAFFPEICCTLIALYCVVGSSYAVITKGFGAVNPILHAGLYALLICCVGQFFWKNKVISIIQSVIFALGSIYMLLAVVAEYKEFAPGDHQGMTLLAVGSLLFGGSAIIAFVMPWKYLQR